jgi:SAM-dependent methyltransferase
LLDALVAIDLLDKDEQGYRLVPRAEQTLLPDRADYWGLEVLNSWAVLGQSQLAAAIRNGERPLIEDVGSEAWATGWASEHRVEAPDLIVPDSKWTKVASLLSAAGIEARDGLRVLDVASGLGITSLALARQNGSVHATLVDRQPTLDLALALASKLGLIDQITMMPGDMRTVDYGMDRFNVVWFGYSLMFFGPEDTVRLLRKAHAALVSHGTVVINQYIADDARRRRKEALISALWLYASTAEGDAYTTSECRGFLEEAGFVNPVERELVEIEEVLMRATKP